MTKIMTGDGKTVATEAVADAPTYIVTQERTNDSVRGRVTRKHVLVAVVGLLIAGIILTAILVGMHMWSQTQKDIVKFTLQFKNSNSEDVTQDVESDPNDNVVMTHVTKPGQDAYIVNDFNKGMQITKLITSDGVNCYVAALNKSIAMEPALITGSDSMTSKGGSAMESFVVTSDPVTDRSFLTKKALDMCKGVSLYWLTRQCGQQIDGAIEGNSTGTGDRNKRGVIYVPSKYGLPGVAGCCYAHWACAVRVVQTLNYCLAYHYTNYCCRSASNPRGIPYPYCASFYIQRWSTPYDRC